MKELNKLYIPISIWFQLIWKLKKSGKGIRESGAVLLGKYKSNKVSHCIALDELDPECLTNGYISFHSNGFIKLWQHCKENNLVVLADVHTHPSSWISQSKTDIENPFISKVGHIAIIVPNYAQKLYQPKSKIGFYEYFGNFIWNTIPLHKIKITLL
jgi:proteasome lid subunit RPN8/RPN11